MEADWERERERKAESCLDTMFGEEWGQHLGCLGDGQPPEEGRYYLISHYGDTIVFKGDFKGDYLCVHRDQGQILSVEIMGKHHLLRTTAVCLLRQISQIQSKPATSGWAPARALPPPFVFVLLVFDSGALWGLPLASFCSCVFCYSLSPASPFTSTIYLLVLRNRMQFCFHLPHCFSTTKNYSSDRKHVFTIYLFVGMCHTLF